VFKNYDESHGLQGREFNIGAYYESPGGEMFFGGINGFNAFHPGNIRDNPHAPPVVLTGFFKFNRRVELDKPLHQLEKIDLTYNDTFISFEFAALDFTASKRNRYAVKLEGFDENWIDLGEMHRATYTNLDGGNYTLRVRGSNNDGVWNETGASIGLTVSPPPWKSWWAYVLYALTSTGIIYFFVRAQRRRLGREAEYRRKLEQDVEARTLELAQRNDELQLLNTKFEEASLTDSLTGLWNRRFLSNYMKKEVSLVLREYDRRNTDDNDDSPPSSLVLLMIDLDGFKPVNDQYGHAAGDEILLQMRDLLRDACRSSEVLVRLGGDEFLIVGRTTNRSSTQFLAERIRRSIENHKFNIGASEPVRLACSIGFTCFPFLPSEPRLLNWEQVLAVADQALYAAKYTARNAWVGIFETEQAIPDNLFQSILEDPQAVLDAGEIDVASSISRARPLDWGLERAKTAGGPSGPVQKS
jgi:diguanylate cyclase (GGDEF)-like protein